MAITLARLAIKSSTTFTMPAAAALCSAVFSSTSVAWDGTHVTKSQRSKRNPAPRRRDTHLNLGPAFQEQLHHLIAPFASRQMQRRVLLALLWRVDVGAMLQQHRARVGVPLFRRKVQSRVARLVAALHRHFDLDTNLQHCGQAFVLPFDRRVVQRQQILLVFFLRRRAFLQQQLGNFRVTLLRRPRQRVQAVVVLDVRVRPRFQRLLDFFQRAFFRAGQKRAVGVGTHRGRLNPREREKKPGWDRVDQWAATVAASQPDDDVPVSR